MVSLVDIGPAMGEVPIRGKMLPVVGMTAEDIVRLFIAFPELRRIVTGKANEDVMATLFNTFPHLLGHLVAACIGKMNEEAEIEAASKLTLGEQWLIVEKCMELTFPQSVTNFLDGLLALVGQKGGVSGWAQATTSQGRSSDALPQAETSKPAGEARPDSSAPGSN